MKIAFFSCAPLLVLAAVSLPIRAADAVVPEIPNFHQVSDHVYRGGQPPQSAWNNLAKLGVKTVIDLRRMNEHPSDGEEKAVAAAGMRYVSVPMNGIVAPREEDIQKVLAILNRPDQGSVFVHCRRGADRTGTVIACYRMTHDQWPNDKALKEAKSLGMSSLEFGMKRYLKSYHPPVEVTGAAVVPAAVTP